MAGVYGFDLNYSGISLVIFVPGEAAVGCPENKAAASHPTVGLICKGNGRGNALWPWDGLRRLRRRGQLSNWTITEDYRASSQ